MMRSAKELNGYVLQAMDGDIGRCKDLLFDDGFWTVRYMVADTAKWLPGRKVLISPISLRSPDWGSHTFPVRLTREQIKDAPSLDEDAPVSRQFERKYFRHHGWPYYWGGANAWGAVAYAEPLFLQPSDYEEEEDSGDPHLRSMAEVTGYPVSAADGDLGPVEDFIVEDQSWAVRYLVVSTRKWLPGRKVLIAPDWIEKVSWEDRQVSTTLTRDEVKAGPEYDASAPVNRDYEEMLYDFYGRPRYWTQESPAYSGTKNT